MIAMRLSEVHHIMEEATMNRDTYDKMILLKLKGMSKAYKEQDEIEDIHELTFEQRLALLIDTETDYKHNHKIERLIENANFVESKASVTQIKYYADRQLNKDQIERLATNEYINRHENLIIVGATGSGKSYIACALGVEACNATLKVMYVRLPDLLAELDLAKVQGNYRKRINQYIKCDLLILDEWLLIGTNNAEQQDILEILEKRYRIHSTVFCSQFDVAGWHSKLGGGALADAIMDRIISKSQTIKIFGDKSMRSR